MTRLIGLDKFIWNEKYEEALMHLRRHLYQPNHCIQGCHNGRFWVKMTVQTSISSVRPSVFIVRMSSSARVYPMDAILPADGFLSHPIAVKFRPRGHVCASALTRAPSAQT
jgi:hypothetical protein